MSSIIIPKQKKRVTTSQLRQSFDSPSVLPSVSSFNSSKETVFTAEDSNKALFYICKDQTLLNCKKMREFNKENNQKAVKIIRKKLVLGENTSFEGKINFIINN